MRNSAVNPAPVTTTPRIIAWLLRVTRPVLAPLGISILARLADQALGVTLVAVGAWGALSVALEPSAWAGADLWALLGILIGISLAKAFLRYLEQFCGHYVAFKALELLRARAYQQLYPQAPAVILRSKSGELLTRLTRDIDRIEVFFAHTIAPAVSAIVIPIAMTATIGAALGGASALAAGVCYLLAVVVVPGLGAGFGQRVAQRILDRRAVLAQHVGDSLQGVAEVVGYGREAERLSRQAELDREVSRAALPKDLLATFHRFGVHLSLLGGVVWLAFLNFEGANLPLAVALLVGFARSWEAVRGVEDFATALNTSLAAAHRVWTIAHTPPAVTSGAGALPEGPGLEVAWEDVTFTYPPREGADPQWSRPAVEGLSFRAEAGKWTCLVGPTGCGKSTALSLALRYFDPDSGRITVGGRDLREVSLESLYETVAVVSQRVQLINDTIAENLRLARPEASDAELRRACEIAGLWDEIAAFPEGLATPVGSHGQALSGGQRGRVALARAVLRRPRVLFLDEYTANLNTDLAERVRANLRQAFPETTVIEVTHRADSLAGADAVVHLDAGRLVAD